jgi:uncharacterized protein
MKKYTIITGASQGIGKSFAFECAKRGFNLILVARNKEQLSFIKTELEQRYNVDVHTYSADLTSENAVEELYKYCKGNSFQVDILINNAGMGFTDSFLNLNLDFYEKLLKLNNTAHLKMMRLFAADMIKLDSSYIINISSMAGILPMPFKSVYSASKHFLTNLSLALYQEFRNTSLHVSTVCPGGVSTNEAVRKRMEQYTGLKKMSFTSPEKVVSIALKESFQKKPLIIPGLLNKLTYYLMKLIPIKLKLALIENTLKDELDRSK